MKNGRLIPLGLLATAALVSSSVNSSAAAFLEDFDTDTSDLWRVNASGTSDRALFNFDYSTVGIPSAPRSQGGTTFGLKLQANMSAGVQSGISVSPIGQSFTGDYTLRFDLWHNYNGPLGPTSPNIGGSGSTQVSGGGIGTSGTVPQWAGGANHSLFFGATGDGGSTFDYRVYRAANLASPTTGWYAAGTTTSPASADARNNVNPYYSGFGGEAAPADQLAMFPGQTGTTTVGAQGFAWRDVVITKVGNTVTYEIDGTRIATVDISDVTLGGSNILLNHFDINAGSSTDPLAPDLLFGLFDNVRVTVIPEPGTYAMVFGLMAMGLGMGRRYFGRAR